jgi:MFS family permease
MVQQRWRRIIPVALVMYTIAYVDRTNVSLALDPSISSMMKDLDMNDQLKGRAAGIFFLGYMLLQIPSGYWASRWSARKLISLCLLGWGVCAVGCGLAQTFRQFELMRFLLGVAESGVFPATLVLLANWFPRAERARANAWWTLCQPLAIAGTAPLTSWLLGAYGWRTMLILEGTLPFLWLPLWRFCIRDHPAQAAWLDPAEREYIETQLRADAKRLATPAAEGGQARTALATRSVVAAVVVLIAMYFLQNCQAYGCMTFFTATLKDRGFTAVQYGLLFGLPYALTAALMLLNSAHSDRTQERRGHVAAVYLLSGMSLILAVWVRGNFWLSYALLCLAIPGPFAAMGPFWAIPGEILPGARMGVAVGLVNAFGNLGGFVGPSIVGRLKQDYQSLAVPFTVLGLGMVLGAALAYLLPAKSSSS